MIWSRLAACHRPLRRGIPRRRRGPFGGDPYPAHFTLHTTHYTLHTTHYAHLESRVSVDCRPRERVAGLSLETILVYSTWWASSTTRSVRGGANLAYIRQSRPHSGLGFQENEKRHPKLHRGTALTRSRIHLRLHRRPVPRVLGG